MFKRKFIFELQRFAKIKNDENNNFVVGTSGKDKIYNYGDSVTVSGGKGNDYIDNAGLKASLFGGADNDSIVNHTSYSTLIGGDGKDSINNYGNNAIIAGGKGNDSIILSRGTKENIIKYAAGDGKDTVYGYNPTDMVSLTSGSIKNTSIAGNNLILKISSGYIRFVATKAVNVNGTIYGDTSTKGTSGKDVITNFTPNVTITTYEGNDTISNIGENVSINAGDGKNTIYNFVGNVTIAGGTGNDNVVNYCDFVSINAGSGNDDIYNYGESVTIDGGASNDYIQNTGGEVYIDGGVGKDYIGNSGDNVTINGGTGNDTISNSANYVTINGGEGNDRIYNHSPNVTVVTGAGNDTIYNYESQVKIDCSAGNDYLYNDGDDVLIVGGEGNDTIYNWGDSVTINSGAGNDLISLSPYSEYTKNILIQYAEGDGNDTISGFNADDTLKISKDSYSSVKLGNDVIVTVGDGSITLLGAASLSAVNIDFKEKNSWKLSDTTATYGTTKKTLVTVSGVKSLDGIRLKKKVVTISAASLNKSKVTISNGYTLKLGKDVTQSTTQKAAWSLSNSTATYKSSSKTAGYTLANNTITYSKATTAKTLATVKGVKSLDDLKVSGKTIKLAGNALSSKVTVGGDYNFEFASDYKKATISGTSGGDSITARGKKISVNGGKGDDTIKIFGTGTVTGGKGADVFAYKSGGANVITDYAEEDKINLLSGTANISTSGDDVIFKVGKGKITVKDAADKKITYIENGAEKIYLDASEPVIFNAAGTTARLTSKYTADNFTPNDYGDYANTLVTIDASAVNYSLEVTGNKSANKIIGTNQDDTIDGAAAADIIFGGEGNDSLFGGAGNDCLSGGKGDDSLWGGAGTDTLFGGAGNDIFIYDSGNDTIADYEAGVDTIVLASGKVNGDGYLDTSGNVIFKVGLGQILVQNAANQHVEVVDTSGNILARYNSN